MASGAAVQGRQTATQNGRQSRAIESETCTRSRLLASDPGSSLATARPSRTVRDQEGMGVQQRPRRRGAGQAFSESRSSALVRDHQPSRAMVERPPDRRRGVHRQDDITGLSTPATLGGGRRESATWTRTKGVAPQARRRPRRGTCRRGPARLCRRTSTTPPSAPHLGGRDSHVPTARVPCATAAGGGTNDETERPRHRTFQGVVRKKAPLAPMRRRDGRKVVSPRSPS